MFVQGIVPRQNLRVRFAEMFRQLLGDVHRTVLAAGAADGDGQVTAICLGEFAHPFLEERREIRNHAAHAGVARKILDDG